jgi:hypothetical protein
MDSRSDDPPDLQLFGLLDIKVCQNLLAHIVSGLFRQVIKNWAEVAHHSAQRLRPKKCFARRDPIA